MSDELANIFSAAERLIDQLDNPVHIAIMENYRMHAMLEYCGRFEELLAPEMTIEHPVYRICTPQTGYRVYDGMDEVRNEFYAPLVERGQTVQTKEQEHIAVNDWGFSQEQFVHQHLRGSAARAKGHDIADRDLGGYFIEDHWTSMYFIYNDEARLIGEHIYHSPATDLREITVDEFYDLDQLRAVLEPKIAAGPHRRLSVGSTS